LTVLALLAWLPAEAQVQRREGVEVAMRDGVRLMADLWLPIALGKYPVITIRTPYGRRAEWLVGKGLAEYFANRGYAVLSQDVRGTGDSKGNFEFLFQEGIDGYDTIEWAAAQPWSNGRVASMGLSYLGAAQWVTARARPPHLVCMAPTAAGGQYFNELPYAGGAFALQWALMWLGQRGNGAAGQTNWTELLRHRPLRTLDSVMGRTLPLYRDFLDHPTLDGYWAKLQYFDEDFIATTIPTLTITGWFDANQPGALYYWRGMRSKSPAKNRQYLLIGPWDHGQTWNGGGEGIGAFQWGKAGIVDYRPIHLAWFDYCLKGSQDRFDFPRARVFVTGSNQWADLVDYPPSGGKPRALYLRSNGKANTGQGDGTLSWDPPGRESPDQYRYDPRDPTPSLREEGGFDQRATHSRQDVLIYTGPPLVGSITILGKVKLELYVATDGLDTDFTAKLIDVFPDGRSIMIGPRQAIFRARYRYGFQRDVPMIPGKPTKLDLDLYDVGHTFLPGHRIQVEISSSAFPAFNPNQNTGNPVATDTVFRVARQMIFHDGQRASRLFLPVAPPPPVRSVP
jgi:putative CocE/NonD family hydrolase